MEIQVTTSLSEMLKNPDITAVAISTPAATHLTLPSPPLGGEDEGEGGQIDFGCSYAAV
jgi:hypothetical protein